MTSSKLFTIRHKLVSIFDQRSRTSCFICGCGHSGTTLIANILATHDDVYIPTEETCVFMNPPGLARELYKNLIVEMKERKKKFLIEKTPKHIRYVDLIRKIAPNSKLLIPIRDGRDVAVSFERRMNAGGLEFGADRWVQDTKIALHLMKDPLVYMFKFEDFLECPEKLLKRICGFIGIPYSDKLLDYHKEPNLWFGQKEVRKVNAQTHEAFRNWQVNQPLFNSSGRWRKVHTEEKMNQLFVGSGNKLLRAFGYIA